MGWFRRNEHDEEQLSAYLDGELDARQAEKVERHLATCDTCAALLEELRSTRALLSALPSHTPGRSFVLGAEHARAPVRDAAGGGSPTRRFGWSLAPAAALTVFVALVFVDVGNFNSTSSDDSTANMPFASSAERQMQDGDASAGAGAAEQAPSANTMATGSDTATQGSTGALGTGETAPDAIPSPVGGGAGGAVATPEGPPAALSAESAAPTPDPAAAEAITAAGDTAAEEAPQVDAFAPADSDSGDGISTLRILQIAAAVAFLASGFYVFVWPHVSRGGS